MRYMSKAALLASLLHASAIATTVVNESLVIQVEPLEGDGQPLLGAVATGGDWIAVGRVWGPVSFPPVFDQSVVMYRREGFQWRVEQVIPSPLGAQDGGFGTSIALQNDWLVVGSLRVDFFGQQGDSAVHLFQLIGGVWTFRQSFFPDPDPKDPFAEDRYTWSIDLQGSALAVGAPASVIDQAAVYVYRRSGDVWSLEQKILGSFVGDEFGRSLVLGEDFMLVLAPNENGLGSGAVHVLERSGSQWNDIGTIHPPEDVFDNSFGDALQVRGTVGYVRGDDRLTGPVSFGQILIYDLEQVPSSPGARILPSALFAPSPPFDLLEFGRSLFRVPGGIVVGAPHLDPNDTGAAFLFHDVPGKTLPNELAELRSSTLAASDLRVLAASSDRVIGTGRGHRVFVFENAPNIPTVGTWGIASLALCLMLVATLGLRRPTRSPECRSNKILRSISVPRGGSLALLANASCAQPTIGTEAPPSGP